MSHYITLTDVNKIYRTGEVETAAVKNVSLTIEKGEFCVVVGSSGAGKTTILNMLGGMDTCTSGSIRIDDIDIASFTGKQLTTYRRFDVGFVFQFYNLVQNLTAKENVELASEICKHPRNSETVLAEVGLSHRMDNFPAQLSGGEQQRVAIARALAKNPKLLLCDEPTGALDDETGKAILQLLQQTALKSGMTVVLITHNTAITAMAQKVIKIKNGQVDSIRRNKTPKSVEEIAW